MALILVFKLSGKILTYAPKDGGFGGQVRSACLQQAGRMTSGHLSRHKRASLVSRGSLWKKNAKPSTVAGGYPPSVLRACYSLRPKARGGLSFPEQDNKIVQFSILTIFPEMFGDFCRHGIVRRALENKIIGVHPIDLRQFAAGRHRVTDDRPYGGGCGMVMKPEPLMAAIRALRFEAPEVTVIHLSPKGRVFGQDVARQFAALGHLAFICGRYEGVDARVEKEVDVDLCLGDYILTGGELGAMVVMDAVTRLLPGALGKEASVDAESFNDALLEHDHYTRPVEFEGDRVPEVLQSGHHQEIEAWRMEYSLIHTLLKRPDLLAQRRLTKTEAGYLIRWYRHLQKLLEKAGIAIK